MRSLAVCFLLAAGCGAGSRVHDVPGNGTGTDGDAPSGPGCTGGLHCQIAACDTGVDTVITGRVFAPNGKDPVPHATVFVPDHGLPEFPVGASCDLCTNVGAAAAITQTGFDGRFQLDHVPAGDAIPLVVQLGHFRRVLHLHVDPCATAALPSDAAVDGTRLPHRDAEFDGLDSVPRIAVATGDYDQIECVLDRMGIDGFDLYNDRGSVNVPPAPAELGALLGNAKKLMGYNILVVNCTQNEFEPLLADKKVLANLAGFVAMGGRLYVTDWAYDVIEQVPEFAPYLCFEPQNGGGPMCRAAPEPSTAADTTNNYSNSALVKDADLAGWLAQFPGVIAHSRVPVDFSFVVVDSVAADRKKYPTTTWVEGDTGSVGVKPMTVTFDYQMCGRVHFSTYNTEPNGVVPDNMRYPNCKPDFSPQERILEYLVFEIANCVGPPVM